MTHTETNSHFQNDYSITSPIQMCHIGITNIELGKSNAMTGMTTQWLETSHIIKL